MKAKFTKSWLAWPVVAGLEFKVFTQEVSEPGNASGQIRYRVVHNKENELHLRADRGLMKVLPCWLPSEVLLAESMSLKSKSVADFSAGG